MYTQFDEKGKIFTNVVTKKPVRVTIQTVTHLIRGDIHIRPDQRIKDALETENIYLAITDAEILGVDQQVLYRAHFMVIRHAHIIWLLPDDEIIAAGEIE